MTCHDDLVVEGDTPEAESMRGQGAGGEPGGRPRHQQLRGVQNLVEPAQGLTTRHQEDLHTAVICIKQDNMVRDSPPHCQC